MKQRPALPARKGPIAVLDTPKQSLDGSPRSRLRFAGDYLPARKGPIASFNISKQSLDGAPRFRLRFAGDYLGVAAILGASVLYAASNPFVGVWKLDSQAINGQKINSEPLVLKVTQDGDKLAFAFSVPINDVYFVSMSYTVKPDGSEGDVRNARGDKIGTVRISPAGPSQYSIVLKGLNRPDSSGKLTVSPDGKTLTSEQDAAPGGRATHSTQLFSRNTAP